MSVDQSDSVGVTKLFGPAIVELQPKFMLGLTTGVVGNCLFLTDDVIVYPVSGVIVVYDTKNHSQALMRFTEQPAKTTITAMDLNPINSILALATTSTEKGVKPTVSFYDLSTSVLKNAFTEPEDEHPESNVGQPPPRRFANVRFLEDDTFITALAVSDSDCVLYYYNWRNFTMDTSVRVDSPVADIAVNPIDTTICCFVGKDLFISMTRTDMGWNQYGFSEATGVNFMCVCWICGDRCLSGTENGLVVLIKNGELQAVYTLDALKRDLDVTMKMTLEKGLDTVVDPGIPPATESIRICVAFRTGLLLVVGDSAVHYFQKLNDGDEHRKYVKNCVFKKLTDWYLKHSETDDDLLLPHYVESVFVSPNRKTMMCITRRAQIYWAPLESRHPNGEYLNLPIPVQPFGEEMHYGSIGSMSTSLWKPILMTCGQIDSTIKVWNYAECRLLLSKNYLEQVTGVSIHPTGLYSVATFANHVEYQMVQLDDLVPLKYFPMTGYGLCSFSGSGHMFALGKRGAIDVYCSIMFEKLFSCQDHFQTIDKLLWSNNDRTIVVLHTTTTQRVTTFDTKTGLLVRDIYSVINGTDLAVAEDGKRMYIIARTGNLKEFYEREAIHDVNCQQGSLNAVAITKTNLILFIATQTGVVLGVVLPILYDEIDHREYKMHSHSVTKLCLAVDGSTLISCSEDGSLCIWDVKDVEKKNNINLEYFDDILANGKKLYEINQNIDQIKMTVNKLETKSTLAENEIKTIKEQDIQNAKHTHTDDINHFVKLNKEIADKHDDVINILKQQLHVSLETNEYSIVSLESKYCYRLAYKFEKQSNIENELFSVTSKLKEFSENLLKKLDEELMNVLNDHKRKLKEKDEDIMKCQAKLINEKTAIDVLLDDTENDVDENVFETKTKFIFELKEKKELHLKTMSELENYKMKYNKCLATTADFKHAVQVYTDDLEELNQFTENKKGRIFDLKTSLKFCYELMPQKDEQIQALRQSVNKLEKTLLVEKSAVAELQQLYNSLVLKIQENQILIEQLGIEYDDKIKMKNNLELLLSGLNEINTKLDEELDVQNYIVQNRFNFIKQMKIDISLASQHHHSKVANTTAILELFHKYAFSNSEQEELEEVLECRIEFSRQMQFLNRSIDDHKKTLKSFENKNELYHLVMDENTRLIEEINVNRNIAKEFFTKYKNLKYQIVQQLHT